MNQYCVYCASCIEISGCLYCDKHEKDLGEGQAKHANSCQDYYLSPMGHIRTGKQYRPQMWKQLRKSSGMEKQGCV